MKIFCSGIGGIGLSAYASLMREAGHDVSGSDRAKGVVTDDLTKRGVTVHFTQDGSAVTPDLDLFVYSEAVPEDAPERAKARELGIRSISYFEAVGEMLRGKRTIAVCGTHGKSSTTAMAAVMLQDTRQNPTVVVGTRVPQLYNRNFRVGGDLAVVEACEYRRNFLHIDPHIVLLTAIDGDHFDAFKDQADYERAYAEFFDRLPKDGVIIAHGEDDACMRVARASGRTVIDADREPMPKLSVPGLHMRKNARLVKALGKRLGLTAMDVERSLGTFRGTWRRMEVKGTIADDVIVVDDYGHHPAEAKATLSAMREAYPDRRIVCVFQPHTHERTLTFYDDFTTSFKDADLLIVPNVYVARSQIETATVDFPKFLADVAKGSGIEVIDGKGMENTLATVRSRMKPHDLVVTMGAGDVTSIATRLMSSKG